jgi:very-short-patch-repair endonuclease
MNKTEGKFYNIMINIYPDIINQFKVDWCKNKRILPYDFCIPKDKIIIELDGPQHFRQISNWSSPEQQLKNYKFKEECANNNDYSIIRVLQEYIMNDTYDWLKELCETIEEIKNGDEIANVYLCKNGEYDLF